MLFFFQNLCNHQWYNQSINTFSLPLVNVNYNEFTVYETMSNKNNVTEMIVKNLSEMTINEKPMMPKQLMLIVGNDSSTLVAHNWFNQSWLAFNKGTIYYTNGSNNQKLEHWELNKKVSINVLFFYPKNGQFYALSGSEVSLFEFHRKKIAKLITYNFIHVHVFN